jgi:hypothetical protein
VRQFYFDTGVRPENRVHPKTGKITLEKGAIWRGTMVIPFKADVPEDAFFMFGCDNPNLKESEYPNVIVRELFDTTLTSKYGYFRIIKQELSDE